MHIIGGSERLVWGTQPNGFGLTVIAVDALTKAEAPVKQYLLTDDEAKNLLQALRGHQGGLIIASEVSHGLGT